MKIPALYLPRAGFFIALNSFQNFFRQSSGMANLSLHEETHDVRESIVGLSAACEGVEPAFLDPKIINQTLYNFSDFIP